MPPSNLWLYRPQILRVVQESLEVSLNLCNTELKSFTMAKIFDIFNQILPSAFVLNTGYWPFYNTLRKESICVCARYAISCRHYQQNHHWIDLDNIQLDNSIIFFTKHGIVEIVDSDIDVIPVTGDMPGYLLNLKLTFQYKKIERGRPRRKKDENLNINQQQAICVAIYSRYSVHDESYPAFYSILFQPSPFSYDTYGTQFPQLLQLLPTELNRKYFTASLDHMPTFSLILHQVNLPLYIPLTTIAVIQSRSDAYQVRRMSSHKSTQTEDRSMLEIWRCKEIIGSLKPLWDDLNLSENTNLDLSYSSILGYNQSLISNTSTQTVEELPLKEQDNEYDVQWPCCGFQKTVGKRRRKKMPTSPVSALPQTNSTEQAASFTYAAAVKQPSSRKKKMIKKYDKVDDNPDLLWIETQVSEQKDSLTEEQIGEQFDIAEEFIREDLEKPSTTKDDYWWSMGS